VEAGANQLPEQDVIEAIDFGDEATWSDRLPTVMDEEVVS